MISRRGLIGALIAAPAVIRVAPLMKINSRLLRPDIRVGLTVSRLLDDGEGTPWDYSMPDGVIRSIIRDLRMKELYGRQQMPICMVPGPVRERIEFEMCDAKIPAGLDIGGPIFIGGREYRVERMELRDGSHTA